MRPQNPLAALNIRGALSPFAKGVPKRLNLALLLAITIPLMAYAQAPTPGQNVNMVSGITWPDGDPFLQRQNEPSMAVSTRNSCHLLAGANDYRTVDLNFFAATTGEGETGDAWLGLFKSFDCGATWQSTLFPGYPLDKTPEGNPAPPNPPNPLKLWSAASDPVVRAGPSGFFGYSGIAFNRGSNNGVVFFGRFVDLNNKENGTAATGALNSNTDPIRYVGTSVVAKGSATQFLDKPWIAIDVLRQGSGCNIQVPQPGAQGGSVTQSVAVGNVYLAYTAFNFNNLGLIVSSQIFFSRSIDCGATWSKPVNLTATDDLFDTDQDSINQGATIAIDPQTGFVYVAWRRFATSEHTDAIVAAASISGGQWFTPGVPVITLPKFDPAKPPTGPNGPFSFFDQGTTSTSIRTNAYPALAVANSGKAGIPGQIYLAWSQRGVGPLGEARIMLASSPNCVLWVPPFPIDNGPMFDDLGNSFPNGHQFSPQLIFTGGKLMALYYDLRTDDHTIETFDAVPSFPTPDQQGRFVRETINNCAFAMNGTSLCMGDTLSAMVTPFLADAGLTRRHTLGVTVAQFDPLTSVLGPGVFKNARVSQYRFGTRGDGNTFLQQLELDPPNLPIFQKGHVPFFGDYLGIASLEFVLKGNSWVYNSTSAAPVSYATWTDNRDVRPPLDGDWTNYAPVNLAGSQQSVFDPTQTRPSCLRDGNGNSLQHEGERNQNIYSSNITQGLVVSSPQNSKPLSATVQRAFVILVQNFSNFDKNFLLTIANQPPGGKASFCQFAPCLPSTDDPLTNLPISVAAHSGIARAVFATSTTPSATITINVNETTPPPAVAGQTVIAGGLSSFVVLNPDPLNPALVAPDGAPSATDAAGQPLELYDPTVTSPNALSPNALSPNALSPNALSPNALSPTPSSTGLPNTNVYNLSLASPNALSPNALSPNALSPNALSPNALSPNALSSPIATAIGDSGTGGLLTSSPISDGIYGVTNKGNTAASYHVKLIGNAPAGIQLQLQLNKIYATPVAVNCQLTEATQNIQLANITSPVVQTPPASSAGLADPALDDSRISNATLSLRPGESALIILRAPVTVDVMKSIVEQITPLVIAHAANTGTTTPSVAAPLFITTATLPDGVAFLESSFYSAALQAIGGKTPYQSWSIIAGSLPPGLSLSLDIATGRGLISGSPSAVGTFNFTVQVTDSAANTALRQLSIRVAAPLRITSSTSLTETVSAPFAFSLTSTGGTTPILWSATGLPSWLSLTPAGVLSGTPLATGTFSFTATVSDSGSPAQIASRAMTLSVVPATPPAPPSSTLLCDNFNAAAVTQQAGGPPNPTTCSFSAPTEITQVATYHYNGGIGATPGTISLTSGDRTFGPFQAVGVAGQGGPNEAWVATPNVIVPAGTSTVTDSGLDTWSFNPGSNNSGFVRVWGFPVMVNALTFFTQPRNTVAGQFISPPVQVKATDSSGAVLPFIAITISIGTNPSAGTLSGTLTQTTNATGIATFNNLSIDRGGNGYTLLASSGAISATSNSFNIVLLVANAGDTGAGSLRQAILDVNALPGSQPISIVFNILGNGVQTIAPQTDLPTLTHPAILDATTQRGYAGAPIIELNGSAGVAVNGLHITAGNSTVRGFAINRFSGDGILLDTNGGDVIQANYIGTDVTGTIAQANKGNGIQIIDTPNNTIGGTTNSTANVISGNTGEGVRIDGALATGNLVQGNYIGTSASGSAAVGNGASGIYIRRAPNNSVIGNNVSGNLGFAGITICGNATFCGGGDNTGPGTPGNNASGNVVQGNNVGATAALRNNQAGVSIDGAPNTLVGGIGGVTANTHNFIGFNGTNGVQIFSTGADNNKILGNAFASNNVGISVAAGTGNTLSQNSIFGDTGLGIDLAPAGVNLNTSGGAHNFPVITSTQLVNGTTTINGTLNSAPAAAFTIEFFSNASCNASGYGEGATFLGSTNVGTDGSGNAAFSFSAVAPATQSVFTTTATDAGGTTSEFSACMPFPAATTVNLTPTSAGTLLDSQSFNETRAADIKLLTTGPLTVSSMTLSGLNIVGSSALSATVGARIYDSSSGALVGSGNANVNAGSQLTVTIPIAATLASGATYRVGFYVQTAPSPGGGSGTVFVATSFPYTEPTGRFQIVAAWDSSPAGDVFPTTTNTFLPQMTITVAP